ncbi:S8 family serine peptidase [uncultured Rhodoblastus sp.]|uniref:S8 family peptidase n=1 Tax=uncultured Rhodoblastus sp. TaxID=543037 RepID=UPI0026003A3F|nr:S8 family serine peptidase [uncultured Rhodoblastus sp.]
MTGSDSLELGGLIDSTLDPRADGAQSRTPPARFLVVSNEGGLEAAREALRRRLPNEPFALTALPQGIGVLEFSGRAFSLARAYQRPDQAHELGRALAKATGARFVEPDLPRVAAPDQTPREPGQENLEGLDNFPLGCWSPAEPALPPRWALEGMNLFAAWARSEALGRPARGEGIIIAQPDTGITKHPELAGVDVVAAFNTLGDGPANDATDPLQSGFALNPGHGTGTASVVVSRGTGPGDPFIGSAPKARHLPIRAIRSVWLHEEIPIAAAIDKAVENGAQVITMSLGGPPLPFSPLREAIERAVKRHVIVMAAAGNCVGLVVFPARLEACIAVAGVNAQDQKWPGSSSGPEVEFAAPAQNVYRATIEKDGVGQGQGTSFAVALAAGAAACWIAHHGRERLIDEAEARGETLQTMFRRIARASARRPAGWDGVNMGGGVIDALALIEAPFDLGRGVEAPVAATPRTPAEEMRVFVAEAIGADPGMADDALLAHGGELAAALLARRLDPTAPVTLSKELEATLTPTVRAALDAPPIVRPGAAPFPAAPAIPRPRAEQDTSLVARIDAVKRALSMGKALSSGARAERAALESTGEDLPSADEFEKSVERLFKDMPESEIADRADFERALDIVREHGAAGLRKVIDPAAVLSGDDVAAMEAVIKADGSRPSFMIKENWIDEANPLIRGWRNDLVGGRDGLKAVAALVGRIQPSGGHANRYCGTGTLVDAQGPWVLTNFHVLAMARRSYPVLAVDKPGGAAIESGLEIDFLGETGRADFSRFKIVEAVYPTRAGPGFGFIDAVLLKLGDSVDGKPLPTGGPAAPYTRAKLSAAAEYVTGEKPTLATIGFPGPPARSEGVSDKIDWGFVASQLFGGSFGVKRLAPGAYSRALGSDVRDTLKNTIGHDATTLKGASGSLLFAFKDADTPGFGLHFTGYDSDSNFALSFPALKDALPGFGGLFS